MSVKKYYPKGIGKLNKLNIQVGRCPLFLRDAFGFFCCINSICLCRCRSPPTINFEFKNLKLIGGKKDGRTPKKKKA